MRKDSNGSIWKIISILVTLSVLAGGAIYGYASLNHDVADNCEDLADMKPDFKKNNEHRIKFEEKVTTMEKNVGKILTIVTELEKK